MATKKTNRANCTKKATVKPFATAIAVLTSGESTISQLMTDMTAAGLKTTDLDVIETSLIKYGYTEGLPFADEDAKYAKLLKADRGLQLAQQYMDFWG